MAIIPPWISPQYIYIQVAILIGLVGVCIGFLIENALRRDQQAMELEKRLEVDAQRISEILREISPITHAPGPCKEFINQVVNYWAEIDRRGEAVILSEVHHDKAREHLKLLMDLAAGAITVGIDGPYSVRLRPFEGIDSYKAASMGPIEFWLTNFGKNYLETQRQSIASAGILVERVFILEESQVDTAEPILRAQVAAGIQVWVLLRRSVSEHHREHMRDQGVIQFKSGQKLLMQPLANHYQEQADRERLSVVHEEILAAERSLEILKRYAEKLDATTTWPF